MKSWLSNEKRLKYWYLWNLIGWQPAYFQYTVMLNCCLRPATPVFRCVSQMPVSGWILCRIFRTWTCNPRCAPICGTSVRTDSRRLYHNIHICILNLCEPWCVFHSFPSDYIPFRIYHSTTWKFPECKTKCRVRLSFRVNVLVHFSQEKTFPLFEDVLELLGPFPLLKSTKCWKEALQNQKLFNTQELVC